MSNTYKMPLEPQNRIVFHPWGCACSIVIEGDFVANGTKQFDHSSQEKDLGYEMYSVLLIQEQTTMVVPIEKKRGE
jgi:hypothetical protein